MWSIPSSVRRLQARGRHLGILAQCHTRRGRRVKAFYGPGFSWAILNIPNLHPTVSMHALLVGLRRGKFLDTLYVEPPNDMDQLRARAARYMSIKENVEALRKMMKVPTTTTFTSYNRKRSGKFYNYTH